jgi:hypothetical protein
MKQRVRWLEEVIGKAEKTLENGLPKRVISSEDNI